MPKRRQREIPVPREPILAELDGRIEELRGTIADLETEREAYATSLVRKALPETPEEAIEHGMWECAASPTGRCAYNADEDPALDMCLFCGGPHERK